MPPERGEPEEEISDFLAATHPRCLPSLPPSPSCATADGCWRVWGAAVEGIYRFLPLPNLLSLVQHPHAPAQGQWRSFEEGAGAAGDHFPLHRQGNQRRGCPRGPPSAARGPLPALPALLLLLLPASPTPSTSRAARRWGRSFWPLPERARRFFPGSALPGRERRTLSSGAFPPLGSPALLRSPELSRHFVPAPGEGRPGYLRPTSRHKPDAWWGTSSTLIPAPAGGWARRGASTPAR